MLLFRRGQADRSQARSAWVAMQKGPVPEGRSIGSIDPLGRGYFPDDSRHFVPGYYRALSPGQKHSPVEAPRIIWANLSWPFGPDEDACSVIPAVSTNRPGPPRAVPRLI
jgi:hypothetical protein